MRYRVLFLLSLFLMFSLPLTAADREAEAADIYISALEMLLDSRTEQAVVLFRKLITEYPESSLRAGAEEYLIDLESSTDHSGIVSFYLGNILTAELFSVGTPMLFDITEPVILGGTGILGIGAGIWTAWLMSNGRDMSFGQDLWIEFIEILSMANFQFTYFLYSDLLEEPAATKTMIGGQIAVSLLSRAGTYFYIRDKEITTGRVSTVIHSYIWSHYYYWITMLGLVKSEDLKLNMTLAAVLPDAAAAGTFFLWDSLGWSFARSGLVSLGGLGGALMGGFANLIIGGITEELPEEMVALTMIVCTLAGHISAGFLTSGLEADFEASAVKSGDLMVFPEFSSGRFGVNFRYRL